MPTYQELGFGGGAALTGDRARTVFGQVMGLLGVTMAFCAAGAYIMRNSSGSAYFVLFIGAIALLFGMNFAVAKGRQQMAVTMLFAVGLLLGMAVGPIIHYYAENNPGVVYQAAGVTAAGVAAIGAIGYTTRRDLSSWQKPLFIALIVLILGGLVAMLVNIPGANLIYCIAGLVIFGGFVAFDFNRLARTTDHRFAVLIAASIFLDIFNIFMMLLSLFGGGGSRR